MTTVARPTPKEGGHWYSRDGQPQHFVEKKDGSGLRPTTLRDARKNDWIPSVTTILKVLDKPALTAWKIEQAVLTLMTAPKLAEEPLDAFIKRVLQAERQQDQEAAQAADLGTRIHDAIENASSDRPFDEELKSFVDPVIMELRAFGRPMFTEKIVVSEHSYAGKVDWAGESEVITVVDFKTTKNPPKKSYNEHRLQLAAYAACLGNTSDKRIQTANIYISSVNPGEISVDLHPDWDDTFVHGWLPLLSVWKWMNNWDYNI